jgi:hypothetical protein
MSTTTTARFGLIVDEVKANAVGTGMNWWLPYAARFEGRGQSRVLAISIAGALMEYGSFERDDVDFMRAHMVEHGMHPKTLIIRPWIAELPDCTHVGACKRCGRSHGHSEKRANRAA